MKSKKAQSEIITTVLIILLVLASIVIVWQVVDEINYEIIGEELKLSDDDYASKYVKEFYPEYENCSIEYRNTCPRCFGAVMGANVYCDELPPNRDGLKIKREEPTIRIEFDDITIKEIIKYYEIRDKLKYYEIRDKLK